MLKKMLENRGYSQIIRLLLYIVDLLLLSFSAFFFLTKTYLHLSVFISFWIVLALYFSFYKIYRHTNIARTLTLLAKQIVVFTLLVFSFLYTVNSNISYINILKFSLLSFFIFSIWRVFLHYFFKRYRIVTGRNYKEIIVIGYNDVTKKLIEFFKEESGYGYKYLGFFTTKNQLNKLGSFEDVFNYIEVNVVDEIYCSIKELTDEQMSILVLFAEKNLLTLKFIPDNKYLFSKKLRFENYNIMPILSLSEIPLKTDINKLMKRGFDIVFSILVIVFLLSWFTPILALIIRLESKGPVFFKQLRYGSDFDLFECYKFRSMCSNSESDSKQASKNDARVTKVGKFIRRTSIDELPQFFNVLFGNMSVVGPRPLLLSHTNDYKDKINKFMIRHMVKPGITGLAQVSGYRGNIEKDQDMQNRVKFDVFYVENWSTFLDLKIISRTIFNVIKGEEKAY